MYLADMKTNSSATAPGAGIERYQKLLLVTRSKQPHCPLLSQSDVHSYAQLQHPAQTCIKQAGRECAQLLTCSLACCRLIFVLDGVVKLYHGTETTALHADDYAYMPPDTPHRFALMLLTSSHSVTAVSFATSAAVLYLLLSCATVLAASPSSACPLEATLLSCIRTSCKSHHLEIYFECVGRCNPAFADYFVEARTNSTDAVIIVCMQIKAQASSSMKGCMPFRLAKLHATPFFEACLPAACTTNAAWLTQRRVITVTHLRHSRMHQHH